MSETTSCLCRTTAIFSLLLLSSANASIGLSTIGHAHQKLTQNSLLISTTSSKSQHLLGEMTSWQEVRIKKIRELRGKYRNMLTPSHEFAQQKVEEELGMES
jgi:hypothetical protein